MQCHYVSNQMFATQQLDTIRWILTDYVFYWNFKNFGPYNMIFDIVLLKSMVKTLLKMNRQCKCIVLPLTLCLPVLSADNLCKQFGPRSGLTILSGLIWIQTIWHSDGIPEILKNKWFIKKRSADDKKKHAKIPSMQRVNSCFVSQDFQHESIQLYSQGAT